MSDRPPFAISRSVPAFLRALGRGIGTILLVAVSLEILFYIATWWFQIAPLVIADRTKGWRLAPNAKIPLTNEEGPYVFDVNAEGRRDHHRRAPKTPGRTRIVVFGGSNTVGVSVPTDDVYTQVLQRLLRNHEVINVGCVLYELDQQIVLMREIIDDWAPDIVLHCVNDDTHAFIFRPYEPRIGLPRCQVMISGAGTDLTIAPPVFPWWQPIVSRSALVSTFDLLLYRRSHQSSPSNQTQAMTPAQKNVVQQLLLEARDHARRVGARYVAITTGLAGMTSQGAATVARALQDETKIECVHVSFPNAESSTPMGDPPAILREDPGHWSVFGHYYLADQLRHYLDSTPGNP